MMPVCILYMYDIYIYIYIYICIQYTYRHHFDNTSTPIDQQGLGRPKVGDNMIDQQGAGCRMNPAQSEDARLKAQLQIRTLIFQHADQICMAASIFIDKKYQPSQGNARRKATDEHPQPQRQIHSRLGASLHGFLFQMTPRWPRISRGWLLWIPLNNWMGKIMVINTDEDRSRAP